VLWHWERLHGEKVRSGKVNMIQHRFSSHGVLTAIAVTALGLVFCGSRADAQIVGTASGTFVANDPNLPASFSYALQGGGNVIVVGTYIDNTHTVSNVQYAGMAPNGTVTDQRMNLHYFFNPAASGDLTFDFTLASLNNPNSAYFIYELFGVDTSAPVDTGVGATITTTVDNQFIVDFIALNNDDGNLLAPAAGSLLTVAGVSDANGAIGGGSIGAGHVDARKSGAAGVKSVGWQGNDLGFFQGQASVALKAPPLLVDLTLVVNKTTGEMKIRNDSDGPLSFDYYAIRSEGNALDPAGWSSLDDQNIGGLPADFNGNGTVGGTDLPIWQSSYGVNNGGDADGDGDTDGRDFLIWQRDFGQVAGPADGWIEAGGSSTSVIGELFLNGALSLNPGQELSLGAAYNQSVFGANDGDLVFNVSLGNSTQLVEGAVVYVTGAGVFAVPEPSSIRICLLIFWTVVWKRRRCF
jgi:hypothetical protein